ncbi:MAG: S1 RNA-binding domain-containing protein [Anaerolineales bacterium]|nr:S1 RNA-binding domain-containing protein [Anaerolineales bacterium]
MTQDNSESDIDQNWYEEYIDQYEYEQPKRGQILEGEILRINDDAIVVGIGQKRDAIVPAKDLNRLDREVLEKLSLGDRVLVSVIYIPGGDKDLLVSLSQGIGYKSWKRAEEYLADARNIELEVVGHNKGGLLVKFESLQGFVPASQVPEIRQIHDRERVQHLKEEMVGTILMLKAIEVDRQRRRLVFSALTAQEAKRKQRLQELEAGQIFHNVKIASVVNFGIFVDLEGVDGLVHLSELDWQVVKHPSESFKIGDEIDIQILDVDVENQRVSLSRKALLPNPWDAFNEDHHSGEIVSGKVTRVLDFGAFVELASGIVGLVHSSEVGYSASGDPQDVVKAGDIVLVRILDLDPERERVSLSMRRVPKEKQIAWMSDDFESEADTIPEQEDKEASSE